MQTVWVACSFYTDFAFSWTLCSTVMIRQRNKFRDGCAYLLSIFSNPPSRYNYRIMKFSHSKMWKAQSLQVFIFQYEKAYNECGDECNKLQTITKEMYDEKLIFKKHQQTKNHSKSLENYNVGFKWSHYCTYVMTSTVTVRGQDSSVGIVTGYGLDDPGIESQWRQDFPHLSRLALRLTQPPVQWVLALSWG
jgi:hypothetical protein